MDDPIAREPSAPSCGAPAIVREITGQRRNRLYAYDEHLRLFAPALGTGEAADDEKTRSGVLGSDKELGYGG